MSGIYIPGMEMPTSCANCRFAVDGWCYACQPESDAERKRIATNYCPLVPVPPHGRLIDADAFIKKHFGKEYFDKVNIADEHELGVALTNIPIVFNNTPTIIEAEEGET